MVFSPTDGRCQSIQVMFKPAAYRMDSIGTARIECRYGYSWLRDTTARMSADGGLVSGDSADVERGMMLLQCGGPSGVSRFYSYDRFYLDSLMLAADGGGGAALDVWSLPAGTSFTVYKNFPEPGRMTSTDIIGTENYLMEEAVPDFGWRVLDEWKEVLGYRGRRGGGGWRVGGGRGWWGWGGWQAQSPAQSGPKPFAPWGGGGPPPTQPTKAPATTPAMTAPTKRTNVMKGPKIGQLTKRASVPACGVEARKAHTGALRAPLRRSASPTTKTPHEQIGNGNPMSEAFTIGRQPGPPKCRRIQPSLRKTEIRKAKTNPTSNQGAISSQISRN